MSIGIRLHPYLLLCILLCTADIALAAPEDSEFPELDEIQTLMQSEEPTGIVFHVYEQSEDALEWILPRILRYTKMLRHQWKSLPVAVVSHGAEMFALATEELKDNPSVRSVVEELAQEYEIHIEVCGTYASNMGMTEDDFPRYVNMVPFGPSTLKDYMDIGYTKVDLELVW
jgi:intracellular sulfur oxidation DsrE/DsrF family protein